MSSSPNGSKPGRDGVGVASVVESLKPGLIPCAHVNKKTGEPCTLNALQGLNVCRRHAPEKPSALGRKEAITPGYYASVLGDSLLDAFEEAREMAPSEALHLHQEIALGRALLKQSLKLLGLVKKDNPGSTDLRLRIMETVKRNIEHVRKLVETAAKVDSFAKDHVSVAHIRLVVDQMIEIFHHYVGGDPEVVEAFTYDLRHRVKLPRGDGRPQLDVEIRRLEGFSGSAEERATGMKEVAQMVGLAPAKRVDSSVVAGGESDEDDISQAGEGADGLEDDIGDEDVEDLDDDSIDPEDLDIG